MTTQEIIQRNEALAIQKIRAAYIRSGLYEAMALCSEYMGVDGREAYNRVKMLCADLESGGTK